MACQNLVAMVTSKSTNTNHSQNFHGSFGICTNIKKVIQKNVQSRCGQNHPPPPPFSGLNTDKIAMDTLGEVPHGITSILEMLHQSITYSVRAKKTVVKIDVISLLFVNSQFFMHM